jgi:hypothetical protein
MIECPLPPLRTPAALHAAGVIALVLCTRSALGLDLTVSSMEITQGIGSTVLVGNTTTWVRVKVGLGGSLNPVGGVDATLRLKVNGISLPGQPLYSLNGPILALANPDSASANDTINFACLPPSGNVEFTVEVNPNRNPAESTYSNNKLTVTRTVTCRGTVEVAYLPINYTANGAGLPSSSLIEPGIGDAFLRGVYHPGEWNYHLSPVPPAPNYLVWNSSIDSSASLLQITLLDYRNNLLPAWGQSTPTFLYGWLPGNPYPGNGQANATPGDVAFGNSDPARLQRTFAHEIGHCFGRSHITQLLNAVGVDVEHQLKDLLNLPQIMPAAKSDVMVPGLLTGDAWIWQGTFEAVEADPRMQCAISAPLNVEVPMLRISGVIDNPNRALTLNPVTRIARGLPTPTDPQGDTRIIALNGAGAELYEVTVRTDSNSERCSIPEHGGLPLETSSPLYVMVPEIIQGQPINALRIVDVATQQIMAERTRSLHAPVAAFTEVSILQGNDGALAGSQRVRVQWSASDQDNDQLSHTLLYSPDAGASWLPLSVNTTASIFEFDPRSVPANFGNGKFKLVTSDGMNITETSTAAHQALADTAPPATYLISPNNSATFPQRAPIAFHGTSWDVQDKMLSGNSVTWTSSIDGPIGTGLLFINSKLSPGVHVITVKGTDAAGNSSSRAVSITIVPRVIVNPDCNENGTLDSLDIAYGWSADANADGIPDECESLCPSDINRDGVVNIQDLLNLILSWGPCPHPCSGSCPADLSHNCVVNIDDLLLLMNGWGACH